MISDYNVNDEEPSQVCTTDEFTSAESLSLHSLFASALLPAAPFPQRKIERAINSCKVIYLKDCSKQKELGTNG